MRVEDIVKELLFQTKDGPAMDWGNRLAELAAQADVKLELVNWRETPYNIAQSIVRCCAGQIAMSKLTNLLAPIVRLEKKPQRMPKILFQGEHGIKILFPSGILVNKEQYLELSFLGDKITSVVVGRLPKEV
jgi:hypothetical protein